MARHRMCSSEYVCFFTILDFHLRKCTRPQGKLGSPGLAGILLARFRRLIANAKWRVEFYNPGCPLLKMCLAQNNNFI